MACFAVVWIKWPLQRDVAWPIRDAKKVLPLAFAEFGQRFEESFKSGSSAEGNRKADRKIKAGKHLRFFTIKASMSSREEGARLGAATSQPSRLRSAAAIHLFLFVTLQSA